MRTVDIRPPAAGDGRGLSSFYLVIGWIVGGYLAAAILGARPTNLRRTVIRLSARAVCDRVRARQCVFVILGNPNSGGPTR
ncbi:hypothetical protein [Actinomadura sp. NPDC048394]|uniref:hypothetical protein n=1 Tax=Actinomadura sp. NPDC048394 TaxID=3158223 RepID=UPI0033F88ABD